MPRIFHRPGAPAKGQKLFLAVPTYGGIAGGFVSSIFHGAQALKDAGIQTELCVMEGKTSVDDARNELVGEFLKTDCTDLVFLDADMHWQGDDLVRLARYDRDVVAGIYPAKDVDERYPVRLKGGELWAEHDGLLEAECVATGFLRIRRSVIDLLASQAHWFQPNGGPKGYKVPLIFEHTFEDGQRWGEDFTFCRKWRRAGGKIYVSPEMRFQHYGQHEWQGCYGGYLRRQAGFSIEHCLRQIARGEDTLETYLEIHEAWDNGAWPCGPDMLMAAAKMARESNGSIVEFGSGLSTAVLRAAAPDKKIVVYEHDEAWADKTRALLSDAGLAPVDMIVSPLVGEPPYYTVETPREKFSLAVCDGPPHRPDEDRSQQYEVLSRVLMPGGSFLIDDLHFPRAVENLAAWAELAGADYQAVDGEKLFAVGRLRAAEQVRAA